MLTFGFVSAASSNSLTSLVTRVLMPPHKPLSDEIASSSDDSGAASSSAGASFVSIRPLMDAANGLALSIILSAPFSFDAATIFMAFVILAVDWTAFIRRPMALMDGISSPPACDGAQRGSCRDLGDSCAPAELACRAARQLGLAPRRGAFPGQVPAPGAPSASDEGVGTAPAPLQGLGAAWVAHRRACETTKAPYFLEHLR